MKGKIDLNLFRFFVVWYLIGVLLLTFDILPPWLEWANVVFLMTSGLLAMFFFIRSGDRIKGILSILLIFFLSIAIESFGVHTGLFFGEYYYQSDFGPQLFSVPITIGFAWVMVIATSHVLAAPVLKYGRIFYAIYGACIAVTMDLILDPVAYIAKEYWIWEESGFYYDIPFSNFYGWFILSFLLHLLLSYFYIKDGKWMNTYSPFWNLKMKQLYGMMILMFVILALASGLWLASFLTTMLTVAIYLFSFYLNRSETDDQS